MSVPDAIDSLAAHAISAGATDQNVPSPCISVCRMNAHGLCEGCLRTIDEIRLWGGASDAQKRAIWAVIAARNAARRAPDPARTLGTTSTP